MATRIEWCDEKKDNICKFIFYLSEVYRLLKLPLFYSGSHWGRLRSGRDSRNVGGAPLYLHWVIVGAETGNRKGKVIPEREWIENIVNECRRSKVPVFMKNSLAEIWREPLIQEYPWGGN